MPPNTVWSDHHDKSRKPVWSGLAILIDDYSKASYVFLFGMSEGFCLSVSEACQ